MAARTCIIKTMGAMLVIAVFLLGTVPALARGILRDPDIEYALTELARPMIAAAGLSPARIKVIVINDDRMNAFIVDDRTVFIHSGLILRLDSAAELQAVIAHELAHIANGHIVRRMGNRKTMGQVAAVGAALGLAAAASGNGDVAAGIALGVASGASNRFLSHTRAEEAAADASGLRYMAEAGVDPQAMVRVLQRFVGQEALSPARRDAYVRSHPLPRDRMRSVQALAAGLKVTAREDGTTEYWFRRAQAKLSAFLRAPGWTLRQVKSNDKSDIALLRRAVAYHRTPDPKRARSEIDALAAKRPKDPFVHELRGQILLESRDIGGATRAYRRAADLAPGNALILAGLGRALLAGEDYRTALDILERARARDGRDPRMLRDLAVAHARLGQNGLASLATSERYALIGRPKDAHLHATRAAGLLPFGSPGWQRAQDILAMVPEP